jgi:hypothetical protein
MGVSAVLWRVWATLLSAGTVRQNVFSWETEEDPTQTMKRGAFVRRLKTLTLYGYSRGARPR